jgi:membrane-bound serine protease (ClpP class)
MVGTTAVALEDFASEGWVQACGERWWARSDMPLARGAPASIKAVNGLTLEVEPKNKGEPS